MVRTSMWPLCSRARPVTLNSLRPAGRRRERPRDAAVASRSRSATAPGPSTAVQKVRTYRLATGYPDSDVAHTRGEMMGRGHTVRRNDLSTAPGVGAESGAMGGRSSRRKEPPGAVECLEAVIALSDIT